MNKHKHNLALIYASWFGIGYTPLFPGTTTSLVVALGLFFMPVVPTSIAIVSIALLLAVGWVVSDYLESVSATKDPSWIVIDEVVGMWLSLVLVPKTLFWYALAFVVFRFFDASKLGGVKYFEAMPGGAGIMLDDVAAAVLAQLIVQTVYFFV